MERTALIVGFTGAVALRLVERLLADDWKIVGLCRHPPAASTSGRITFLQADLLDPVECARAVRLGPSFSHVFYSARAKHGEVGNESIRENVAMLAATLDAVAPAARDLSHVHLVEGGKWYGLHLGPIATPAREDDPRPETPNFYHGQEDLLRQRQQGQRWTWSASRPNILCDFVPGRARNLTSLIGVYAAVLRELDLPLHFPGNETRWVALMETTDATLLANAIAFITTDPRAANQAFNVTNGDVFRWQHAWPKIATHFGMRPGEVRPINLETFMRDKDPVWQRVVRRWRLTPSRLDDIAAWAYGDFVFRLDHDLMSSTTRLRQAGFHDVVDSEATLLHQLRQYRDAKMLP